MFCYLVIPSPGVTTKVKRSGYVVSDLKPLEKLLRPERYSRLQSCLSAQLFSPRPFELVTPRYKADRDMQVATVYFL